MKTERSAGAFLLSLVLHVVLGAALIWVISLPAPLRQWLTEHQPPRPRAEGVSFFQLPGANAKFHPGGNGRPMRGAPQAPKELVAPLTIPTELPPTKPGAAAVQEEGTGPVVSAGGAGPGIMPQMHDPRIWLPPGAVVIAPKPENVRLDSALHASLMVFTDSVNKARVANGSLPATFTAGGKKYGMDSANVYIADFKIPTALMALLPIHGTGYATADQSALSRQVYEINYQAGQALGAEDFRTAVKRIRERKEREKRARDAAQGKPGSAVLAAAPDPPPKHHEPRVDPIALQTP
jgi:hypothetical protein